MAPTSVKVTLLGYCEAQRNLMTTYASPEFTVLVPPGDMLLSCSLTSSYDSFQELRRLSYDRDSDVVVVFYDATSVASMQQVAQKWMVEAQLYMPYVPVLLVCALLPSATGAIDTLSGGLPALACQIGASGFHFLDLSGNLRHDAGRTIKNDASELFLKVARLAQLSEQVPADAKKSYRAHFDGESAAPILYAYPCTFYNAEKRLGRDGGYLFVTTRQLCFFHGGTIHHDVKLEINYSDVIGITKGYIGLRHRPSLEVQLAETTYSFAGFYSFEETFDTVNDVWQGITNATFNAAAPPTATTASTSSSSSA